jgi:hypothetical protein
VPAAKVAVVTDVDAVLLTTVATNLRMAPGVTHVHFWVVQATTILDQGEWRGRLPLPAGETLEAFVAGAATWHLTVSGYLLDA